MNFFAWQDAARTRTRFLLVLMALAILALTVGINLLAGVVILASHSVGLAQLIDQPGLLLETLTWEFFGYSLLFILLLVGGGSYYRIRSLADGGHRIARELGGRRLDPSQVADLERRLLNVVEEMAIASGTPVPDVYLLDHEPGINAFAAGNNLENAVIGVTRGALEQLSRDELEGVIAHEFSHIVHGDMRLNLRLMGVIFGITMLSEIGQILLRSQRHTRSYSSKRKDSNGAAVAFVGLGLMLLGFAGTFFGSWIKASISRTREFLADASAVQYSRNPDGIANALKRIGGSARGTRLTSPRASEASHMLFASGLKGWLQGLFATHPPLEQRIKKLDPAWDGAFLSALPPNAGADGQPEHGAQPATATATPGLSGLSGWSHQPDAKPAEAPVQDGRHLEQALAQMGKPQAAHFAYAQSVLDQLPERLHRACGDPDKVSALLLALMLSPDAQHRALQEPLLQQPDWAAQRTEIIALAAELAALALPDPLVLLELALPTLRYLGLGARETLGIRLEQLARADQRINLFEWALLSCVRHQLNSLNQSLLLRDHYLRAEALHEELHLILSCFCRVSKMPEAAQQQCLEQALLGLGLTPTEQLSGALFNRLGKALERARRLYPRDKEALLNACCDCIRFDGQIALAEAQTLRAVAIMLECPIPPLVAP